MCISERYTSILTSGQITLEMLDQEINANSLNAHAIRPPQQVSAERYTEPPLLPHLSAVPLSPGFGKEGVHF